MLLKRSAQRRRTARRPEPPTPQRGQPEVAYGAPSPLAQTVTDLQRTHGNQHTGRLIGALQRQPLPAALRSGVIRRVVDLAAIAQAIGRREEEIADAGVVPADSVPDAIGKLRAAPLRLSEPALQALQIELARKSHSLARHGPHLDLPALKARLTTGMVGGEFAPAGEEGFATSFTNAEAYVATQAAAQQKLRSAYDQTIAALAPAITAYDDAARPWYAKPDKATNGRAFGDAMQARKTLYNKASTYTQNGKQIGDNLANLPITIPDLDPKELPASGGAMVQLRERYRFVLTHAAQVGQGMRAKEDQKALPARMIVNPKYPLAGKPSPVWNEDQLQSMGEIKGTATTFVPPSRDPNQAGPPETWEMPQHFPDNGGAGWRWN